MHGVPIVDGEGGCSRPEKDAIKSFKTKMEESLLISAVLPEGPQIRSGLEALFWHRQAGHWMERPRIRAGRDKVWVREGCLGCEEEL